jgi:hypothetical protein
MDTWDMMVYERDVYWRAYFTRTSIWICSEGGLDYGGSFEAYNA